MRILSAEVTHLSADIGWFMVTPITNNTIIADTSIRCVFESLDEAC